MAKSKKLNQEARKMIAEHLDQFYTALGLSVVMLQQTQKALKKDTVTLRVNADALGDGIRGLQRMQRTLNDHLRRAGVRDRTLRDD